MRTQPAISPTGTTRPAPRQERRKAERITTNVPLKLPLVGDVQPQGAIVELSEGGAALRLGFRYDQGMVLHMRLPNGIDIQGEVVNVRPLSDGMFRHGLCVHRAGPATPQVLPPYIGRRNHGRPQTPPPPPAPTTKPRVKPAKENDETMRLLGGSN